MKGYIVTETFSVGGSGWYQVLEGTLYIPDAQIQLSNRRVTAEVKDFERWKFQGTKNVGRNRLKEIELSDVQVRDILEKREQQRRAEKDLVSAVNELYSRVR